MRTSWADRGLPGRISPRAERVAIAAVTAIAAVLILARLAHRSLEQDEAFSAVLVRTPAHVFWHVVTTREANQSAFYMLLRVWSHLGTTEGWERLPSALAAIATVPVVWLVGRRVVPGVAAVIAPSLLVANGFFLRVAQFGRGYAFVVLITAGASLALLIAVQDGRRWAWWVWVVLLATAAYFHTFALLVVCAHLFAVALLPERPTKRKVVLPLALYAVLVAPLVLFIATRSSDQVFWIPRTTPTGIENLGVSLVGDAGRAALAVAVVAAVIAAVSLLRREGTDGWAGRFLVLWLIVPLVIGIGLSLVKPLLVDVYFSIALPPLALMLAAGAAALRPRVIGAVLLAVLLVLGARSAYRQFTAGSFQDWRGADAFLLHHVEAGDAFVVEVPDEREGAEYYVDRSSATLPRPTPCYPSDPWGHAVPISGRRPTAAQTALLRCAQGAPHLWVMKKHGDAAIQTPLQLTGWQRVRTVGFVGIDVEEFAPARR